jgi:hypothetical protein
MSSLSGNDRDLWRFLGRSGADLRQWTRAETEMGGRTGGLGEEEEEGGRGSQVGA